MFTGLIREIGRLDSIEKRRSACRLVIESKDIFKDVEIGDSVSVNGVCLTLVDKKKRMLYFDVMEETFRRSTLEHIKADDLLNLETALRAESKLGGHFVQGHVDCVSKIKKIDIKGGEHALKVALPQEFRHLVVVKGSIAIDGVSLTIGEIDNDSFTVYIIPHTLKATTLSAKRSGDLVNLEFDVIGKYIARLSEYRACGGKITESFLKDHGF